MNLKLLSLNLFYPFILFGQISSTGYWLPVSDMGSSRNGHTVTSLIDSFNSIESDILVTGGFDGIGNLKSAEVYNIALDTWTAVGDMESIRFEHTATALNNGKILIAGGWDGGFINYETTEIYDPITQLFTSGPNLTNGRSGHTATKLLDGRVVFVGGYSNENGNTDMVEVYDPITNTMQIAEPLQEGRSYHTANLMDDGKILVAGGFNPDYGFQMNSVEIYDPISNEWNFAEDMHFIRDYHASITMPNGQILVTGGRFFNGFEFEGLLSAEVYDAFLDNWTIVSEMPQGQSYHDMFLYHWSQLEGSKESIMVVGGTQLSGSGADLTFSTTHSYLPEQDEWTEEPMFNDGRYFYGGAAINDHLMSNEAILICGGFDQTVEIFVPDFVEPVLNLENFKFSVYPNPVQNQLKINGNYNNFNEVVLMAINGVFVSSTKVLPIENQVVNVQVEYLMPGYYIVLLKQDGRTVGRASFIKE